MIISTTNDVSGYRIVEYKGIVRGLVVRSPSMLAGMTGSIKAMFSGGNIPEYERYCEQARLEAFNRMIIHAKRLGADAVIGMHYESTELLEGATEVLAYGT